MTTEAMAPPPRTKSQVLRSFDVADFPALTGREEEWRFTPLKRLRELVTATALTGTAPQFEHGELPIGVSIKSVDQVDAVPRVPVQLFEAIAYALIGIFLFWHYRNRGALAHRGRLTGWFLVLVFGARAVLESWKMPQAAYEAGDAITVGQWLSVPFILLGIVLLWRSRGAPVPAPVMAGPAGAPRNGA